MIDAEAVRIPFEEIGLIDLANYPANVELPATGGIGIPIYILCGLTLVLGPFVYGFSLRRRYGRRLNK
jgi:LPXTG-motif cell wall-anchored protein